MKIIFFIFTLLASDICLGSENSIKTPQNNKNYVSKSNEIVTNDDFSYHLKEMQFPKETSLNEIIIGDKNAPTNVIIYSSYTCLHCRTFHKTQLPKFIKKYVDTKKAKIIFRSYVDDPASFEATKLVRFLCQDNALEFLKMSQKIFDNLDNWMNAKEPKKFLRNLFVGYEINNKKITKEMIKEALKENIKKSSHKEMLKSTKIAAGIMKEMQRALFKYNIYFIPSFIVSSVPLKKLDTLPFDDIKKYIHEGNISAEKLGELVDKKQTYFKTPKGTKISS